MKEIKSIFPKEKLKVGDTVVTIAPFPFRRIDEAFEILDFCKLVILNILVDDLPAAMAVLLDDSGQKLKGHLLNMIELSTGMGEESILKLDYDIVLQLIAEILAVNKDFFMKLRGSKGIVEALKAVKPQETGQALSTADSEEEDSPMLILED